MGIRLGRLRLNPLRTCRVAFKIGSFSAAVFSGFTLATKSSPAPILAKLAGFVKEEGKRRRGSI
jgi:hypothetical protein